MKFWSPPSPLPIQIRCTGLCQRLFQSQYSSADENVFAAWVRPPWLLQLGTIQKDYHPSFFFLSPRKEATMASWRNKLD